jgi:hypothetical protein
MPEYSGEDGGADRRAEDGGEAGGHSGQDQQPLLAVGAVQPAGVAGREASGDEGGRAFAAGRAAGANGDGRGDHLERGYAPADRPVGPVECLDHGVSAVSLGFGREGVNDGAGDEAAQGGDDGNEPQAMRADGLLENAALIGQAGRGVTGEGDQEELLGEIEQPGEELRREAADDPEHDGVEEQARLVGALDGGCGFDRAGRLHCYSRIDAVDR